MKLSQRMIVFVLAILLMAALLPVAQAASFSGTINTDKVFFRTKASTSSDYYDLLKKGTRVTVTGTSGNFYAVDHDGHHGFVMKKFVTKGTAVDAQDKNASSSPYASIQSAKTIAALGSVPASSKVGSSGTHVAKLQQALKIKKYYHSTVDGKYGNGTASAVKAYQKAVNLPQTGTADKTTLNVLWGKASAPKATAAPEKTTTASTDPKMKGITKISQIAVPATSSKGSSGAKVLALQQALKLKGYYKAPINSKYDDHTVAAVKAFQKAHGLYADGVAGNNTIKKLFGTDAPNATYKTERLDWFNGGSRRMPNGATFTVKDVLTGRTFTARRLYGANHTDAEPLTKKDASVLLSVYGGHYSWNRRPILVKYNGRVYAASMNGMPHGDAFIKDNNWPGHFCIHFYGSKTHGTKKVDSGHQNAIQRAMSAHW